MSNIDRITTAIARNNLPSLRKLVRDSATANLIDEDGFTLLMNCALDEDADASLVQHLIDQGADVNAAESHRKYTALHFAARDQRRDIVRTLLAAGAKSEQRDADGKTPLRHCLSRPNRDPAIVEMLKASAADTNATTRKSTRKKPTTKTAAKPATKKSTKKSTPTIKAAKKKVQETAKPSEDWSAEFSRLWKTLVPRRGSARTLQGEMIRLTGKLSDEAFRNGNINWSDDHENAWKFVGQTLRDQNVFQPAVLTEIARHVRWILKHKTTIPTEIAGSPYDELARRAVEWCLAHPQPVALESSSKPYAI